MHPLLGLLCQFHILRHTLDVIYVNRSVLAEAPKGDPWGLRYTRRIFQESNTNMKICLSQKIIETLIFQRVGRWLFPQPPVGKKYGFLDVRVTQHGVLGGTQLGLSYHGFFNRSEKPT